MEELEPGFTEKMGGDIISITSQEYKFNNENQLIPSPRGTISSNDMRITIAVSNTTQSDGRVRRRVAATYQWLIRPVMRMRDAMALTWSDNFSFMSYTASTYYWDNSKEVFVGGKTGEINGSPKIGISHYVECGNGAFQPLSRVIYYVNLANDGPDRNNRLASVNASYAHATFALGNFSVTFTDGALTPSFSITGGSDVASKTASFYY